MKIYTRLTLVLLLAVLLVAAACAPGPNSAAKTPGKDGEIAGFW
jgi:ABC-type glycerol-3-phosphate transport system substrate-binding protein